MSDPIVLKPYQPRLFHKKSANRVHTVKYQYDPTTGILRYGACNWRRFSKDEEGSTVEDHNGWTRKNSSSTARSRFEKDPVVLKIFQVDEPVGFYQFRRMEKFIVSTLLSEFGVKNSNRSVPIDIRGKYHLNWIFENDLTEKEQYNEALFLEKREIMKKLKQAGVTNKEIRRLIFLLRNRY